MTQKTFSVTVTDIPAYMQGLADLQVRNLTGAYAPLTGETMFSVLPSEWQSSSTAYPVFGTWSGGSGDAASMKLYCRGGGHGDSPNNGLYVYSFQGSARPTGWSVAANSLSALSAVANSGTVYADNKPTSVHSYDCGRFDPVLGRYYQISGSYWSLGNKAASYYYDINTQRWSSDPGGASFGNASNLANFSGTVFLKTDGTCSRVTCSPVS
jgi:hypothetical protein